MAALTAVFSGSDLGPESRRTKQKSEIWTIPAGTAADTCAITARQISKVAHVIGGAFSVTSGYGTRTVNLVLAATTTGTTDVELMGDDI